MRTKTARFAQIALAALLVAGIIGCTPSGTTPPAESTPPPATATPAPEPAAATPEPTVEPAEPEPQSEPSPFAEYGMPIVDEKITLTVFHRFDNAMWSQFKDFNESDFIQYLEEVTNIHADFVVPPNGEDVQTLSLLVATRQLPDIIQLNLFGLAGGPGKLLEDGAIIPLNDLMDQYAPDYLRLINSDPAINKRTKLDDGTRWGFHPINPTTLTLVDGTVVGSPEGFANKGPIYNYDLVSAAGFDRAPATIEDYTEMGKALVAMGVTGFLELPEYLSGYWGFVLGDPWSNNEYWNNQNGKVVFAPMLDAYYDFLTTMREWYAEGIVHPNTRRTQDLTTFRNRPS